MKTTMRFKATLVRFKTLCMLNGYLISEYKRKSISAMGKGLRRANFKYVIIAFSAFIIEICSTFYIKYVSEQNSVGMLFFAFIGPFLGLPFAGYMVESKLWSERIRMALALSIGYVLGCILVITIINDTK